MKNKKIKQYIKLVVFFIVSAGLFFYLARAIFNFIKSRDYFRIKEVIVINSQQDFSYLKGKNIFQIDIRNLSFNIHSRYPENKIIRINRVMPDKLIIEFQRRLPVAMIKLNKDFFLDNLGVIFEMPQDQNRTHLPFIVGLADRINRPQLGMRYNLREINTSLTIIKEAEKLGIAQKYPLKTIDVSRSEYVSFSILDDMKIRMTADNIASKMYILYVLLSQNNLDFSKVDYIDLRFKDPVIKFKDVHKK